MTKRLPRILAASAIGLAVCAAGIWLLVRALEEGLPRYRGQPLDYWLQQTNSPDAAARHQAEEVLSATIIPRLTDTLLHDTNDSHFRLALIERLDDLLGIQIWHTTAAERRAMAAQQLGQRPARQSHDSRPHGSA